ncbi:MAG TPA: type II secretion system protein [Bryobacteraceae bacterium]|nr:type II secretion system protein [Bryobacteraceae bacterium]
MQRPNGFTLLEVLVATLIMSIAVAGLLGALAATTRNAARLTDYDRATLLAKSKMDELLADQHIQRKVPIEGSFDPAQLGGVTAGWRAMVTPFETAPGAGPGRWVLDRVELEVWWLTGSPAAPTRHSFTLEGFRRGLLQVGDL